MSLYKNKYRVESARLPHWDYSANGAYFITICTYEKDHLFGEINDGVILLNKAGQAATNFWMSIPEHFPFILLGEFVVMPNHVHGILIINNSFSGADLKEIIPTQTLQPMPLQSSRPAVNQKNEFMSSISPKAGSISSIIRSYKYVVKKEARKTNPDFEWQERFHDHIIRSHESFLQISFYIKHNIKNWKDDRFY